MSPFETDCFGQVCASREELLNAVRECAAYGCDTAKINISGEEMEIVRIFSESFHAAICIVVASICFFKNGIWDEQCDGSSYNLRIAYSCVCVAIIYAFTRAVCT